MEDDDSNHRILSIRKKVREEQINLSDVSASEKPSVLTIAKDILQWEGMVNKVTITGTDTPNGYTILKIKGFEQYQSIVDWCKHFHNSKNPQYSLLTDTEFVGELRLHIKKEEHKPQPLHKRSESKRIPIHPERDLEDDFEQPRKDRRRPYIPK